jgi:hypothetical protein
MSEQALEITSNTNLLADKALDMILYHFLPALKEFTAEGVDEFIANIYHTPLPINNAYVSFWREKLGAMSKPFTPWPDKAPSKKDDMTEILFEPVSQFVRYLHDELNLTWFSAQYYADNTGYYLQGYHEGRKKPAPRLFHFPSRDVIETHLGNIAVDDIGFTDTTRYFTILNGLHYFAAYLNKCGNFTEKEMHSLQSYCVEIYNEHYPEQKELSYDALFFSEFPVWTMRGK